MLVIGARHRPHQQFDLSLLVGDEHVVPTSSARNLGTVSDDNMTLESHVAAICKSAFHIRNISRIKRYLSQANIKTLIHAFVPCKLDHCKFATYWLHLQNCAAWLVVGGRKYDPVTSVVSQLHWLPIEKRIVYRINCC